MLSLLVSLLLLLLLLLVLMMLPLPVVVVMVVVVPLLLPLLLLLLLLLLFLLPLEESVNNRHSSHHQEPFPCLVQTAAQQALDTANWDWGCFHCSYHY